MPVLHRGQERLGPTGHRRGDPHAAPEVDAPHRGAVAAEVALEVVEVEPQPQHLGEAAASPDHPHEAVAVDGPEVAGAQLVHVPATRQVVGRGGVAEHDVGSV